MSSRPSTPSRVWPPASRRSRSRAPSTQSVGSKPRSVSSLPTRSANTHWQTKMVLASTQAPTKSAFTRSSMRSATRSTNYSVAPSATPNLSDPEFKTFVPRSSKSRSVKSRTSTNTVPGRTKHWDPATRSATRTWTPVSRNSMVGIQEEEDKSSCCCIFWILVAVALVLLVILGLCGVFDSKPTEDAEKKINTSQSNDLVTRPTKVVDPVKIVAKPTPARKPNTARLQPQATRVNSSYWKRKPARKAPTPTRPKHRVVRKRKPAPKKAAPKKYRPSRSTWGSSSYSGSYGSASPTWYRSGSPSTGVKAAWGIDPDVHMRRMNPGMNVRHWSEPSKI